MNKLPLLLMLAASILVTACSKDSQVCAIDAIDSAICVIGGDNDENGIDFTDILPQQSVFPNSSVFAGQCTPDGMSEKLFLRSWSDELYLWYDEIIQQNPDDFSVTGYFEVLKTNELTASGAAKDQFHFWLPTDEYNNTSAGSSFGYGISWDIISLTGNRTIKVAYKEPSRADALKGIMRGDELIKIDDIDLDTSAEEGIDALNAALFTSEPNEQHRFYFKRADQTEYDVSLTSGIYGFSAVNKALTLTHSSSRKLGYVLFNSFIAAAEKPLVETFRQFEQDNIDELVLDLRYNGGGLLFLASQLAYMIAGDAGDNKTFEVSEFNVKHPIINPVTLETISPLPFFPSTIGFNNDVQPGLNLPSLNLSRVYILSSEETCSASEAVINGLRGIDIDVVLIGDTTCGKPYGFYPQDNCGNTYFSIQFKGINNKGFGEYSDGFTPQNSSDFTAVDIPGCSVADTLNAELGNPNEVLLKQAIDLIEGGTCNAAPVNQVPMARLNVLRSNPSYKTGESGLDQSNIEQGLNRPIRFPGRVLTLP